MSDIEIYTDEREGLQELMASEEYNTNLVADNPPPVRIRDYSVGERVYVTTEAGGFTAKFDHYTEFPGKVYVIGDLFGKARLVEVSKLSKMK